MMSTLNKMSEEKKKKVLELVKSILNHSVTPDDSVMKVLQNTMFYAELYSKLSTSERITSMSYYSYMHGAYSKKIEKIITDCEDISSKRTIINGKRIKTYSYKEENGSFSDTNDVVETVYDYLEGVNHSHVAGFVKKITSTTSYNEAVDFNQIVSNIENDSLLKDFVDKRTPEYENSD